MTRSALTNLVCHCCIQSARRISSDGMPLSTPEVKTDMIRMARDARETVKLIQEHVLVGLSSGQEGDGEKRNAILTIAFNDLVHPQSMCHILPQARKAEATKAEKVEASDVERLGTESGGLRRYCCTNIFYTILSWLQVGYGQIGIAPLSARLGS